MCPSPSAFLWCKLSRLHKPEPVRPIGESKIESGNRLDVFLFDLDSYFFFHFTNRCFQRRLADFNFSADTIPFALAESAFLVSEQDALDRITLHEEAEGRRCRRHSFTDLSQSITTGALEIPKK